MAALAQTPVGPAAAPAPQPQPRLRVGLLAASRQQPRALVEAFAAIARSPFADIVLLAAGEADEPNSPWLWRAYRRFDGWLFGSRSEAAQPLDLLSQLGGGRPLPLAGAATAVKAWRAEVDKFGLDVLLTVGIVDDALVDGLARHGVWRFDFGGGVDDADGREGHRQVAAGRPISTVSLQLGAVGQPGKLLYQSATRTAPFSLSRNRDKLLRRAAHLPGRVLKAVHRSGGAVLAAARPLPHPRLLPAVAENNLEALRSLGRVGWKIAERGLQKLLTVDQWFIAYRFASGADGRPTWGEFTCLVPPLDRFWADPFPLLHKGRYYIFFEELVFAEGKAHIAVIEIDRAGRCSPARRVLEQPYHLSYPFLIESDGQLFMVPESGHNGSVELYRCEHFPDQWRLEKVLLRAPCCADATFHKIGERWWMFVTIGRDGNDVHDELFLYYADRLDGEWTAHAANPVKSDARSARPAGRLYLQDGQLYRPAQIGAPLYGTGISLNQVVRLTPDEFREEEVCRLLAPPDSGVLGVHTVNRAGDLSVVDGFARRPRFAGRPVERFSPLVETPRETSHDSH